MPSHPVSVERADALRTKDVSGIALNAPRQPTLRVVLLHSALRTEGNESAPARERLNTSTYARRDAGVRPVRVDQPGRTRHFVHQMALGSRLRRVPDVVENHECTGAHVPHPVLTRESRCRGVDEGELAVAATNENAEQPPQATEKPLRGACITTASGTGMMLRPGRGVAQRGTSAGMTRRREQRAGSRTHAESHQRNPIIQSSVAASGQRMTGIYGLGAACQVTARAGARWSVPRRGPSLGFRTQRGTSSEPRTGERSRSTPRPSER